MVRRSYQARAFRQRTSVSYLHVVPYARCGRSKEVQHGCVPFKCKEREMETITYHALLACY